MPWYQRELEHLHAVAAGTLTPDGELIEANDGLLELIRTDAAPNPIGASVASNFIQPSFSSIVPHSNGEDKELYSGLLTIGSYTGQTHCLLARIWRTEGQIRMLAEYDVKELIELNSTVLELNRDYATAQLQLAQANLRLKQREAQILTLSLTDPLTHLGNRRRIEQALEQEIRRTGRSGAGLSALMADLDDFKRVNDTYGHDTGDKVLEAFSDILRENTRATDILGRYGGEEFIVLLPYTFKAQALVSAERLRRALASTLIAPLAEPITVSIGAAEFVAGESGQEFLARADRALYKAKHGGRNRVVAA